MPVLHYGPVPACNPHTWDLRVYGATEGGGERRWIWDDFMALPRAEIIADFHCVTKFSVLGISWLGVLGRRAAQRRVRLRSRDARRDLGRLRMSANLPLDATFAAAQTHAGDPPGWQAADSRQGYPVRLVVPSRYSWKNVKWVRAIEYLTADRRGFWEERGYHSNADPWREQRVTPTKELPGEGPEL
jgi:DMSO/TMAO reductase YedYZ molybdopterin-dependent catalytic subunit